MNHLLDNQNAPTEVIKPRSGIIAFLFAFSFIGLAQMYNGQVKKTFYMWLGFVGVLFFYNYTRIITSFYGFASLMLLILVLKIYGVIDGVRSANRQQNYILKSYNTGTSYCLFVFVIVLGAYFYPPKKILGIEISKIPGYSGNPTLEIDDCVISDKKAYRSKKPACGDIVIFTQADGLQYPSRVVGCPLERLDIIDNIVSINGSPSGSFFVKDTIMDSVAVKKFVEILPNKHKHLIYKFVRPFAPEKVNITNITVPPDHYYLMADNRDNAMDSRYIGFVHKDSIKARMLYSYWGATMDRINIDFTDK
jgi:signal peptidase I